MGFVGDIIGDITGSNSAAKGASKASDAQLQATRESNELLERMWNQSRDDMAPWRDAGSLALNRLLGLTGLTQGGPANAGGLTEAQLREQLLPQFTSQQSYNPGQPPPVPSIVRNQRGQNVTWGYDPASGSWGYFYDREMGGDAGGVARLFAATDPASGGSTGGSVVDEAGLSAEIQRRLQEQQAAASQSSPGTGQTIQDLLQLDPGYQFRLDQGQQALDRQMAARGSLLSGRALKDTQNYQQGMASQEFGNTFNRLAGIAGVGQTATTQTGQMGQGYGQQMAGNIIQGGNARASGYIAQGNAGSTNFSNLLNGLGTGAALWTAFSDRRLKRNIRRVSTHSSGLPWYEFDYVWGEPGAGVMADEALVVRPGAVIEGPGGFLMVNYGAL